MEPKNKKRKVMKILFWSSIVLLVLRYFFPSQKNCRKVSRSDAD